MIPKIVSRFFISANISGNNSNIAIYNNIPSVIEVIIAKNIELTSPTKRKIIPPNKLDNVSNKVNILCSLIFKELNIWVPNGML